eukprot:1160808-Pelagomonas_calceolata.AAC.7
MAVLQAQDGKEIYNTKMGRFGSAQVDGVLFACFVAVDSLVTGTQSGDARAQIGDVLSACFAGVDFLMILLSLTARAGWRCALCMLCGCGVPGDRHSEWGPAAVGHGWPACRLFWICTKGAAAFPGAASFPATVS